MAEPATISKLPYEIESPKSSPEPSDCDNDSNASANSTGFQPVQVPSPPDIAPLLDKGDGHASVTIGGKTLRIPITTSQSFIGSKHLVTVSAPQNFPSVSHTIRQFQQQSSNLGVNRNRRTAKFNRQKQQSKQRVIKFHEYKGPSFSKSTTNPNTSANGTFITTTGPVTSLDGLTPYQVRVQQQQLYLQCQLEVHSKDTITSPILVPIHAQSPNPLVQQQRHQLVQQPHLATPMQLASQQQSMDQQPATPKQPPTLRQHHVNAVHVQQPEGIKSRPVTPSLLLKSPTTPVSSSMHSALHVTRSLTHLEDLKVADLKQELKQRNLAVSGAKPQLIERLRAHRLQQEMPGKSRIFLLLQIRRGSCVLLSGHIKAMGYSGSFLHFSSILRLCESLLAPVTANLTETVSSIERIAGSNRKCDSLQGLTS